MIEQVHANTQTPHKHLVYLPAQGLSESWQGLQKGFLSYVQGVELWQPRERPYTKMSMKETRDKCDGTAAFAYISHATIIWRQ